MTARHVIMGVVVAITALRIAPLAAESFQQQCQTIHGQPGGLASRGHDLPGFCACQERALRKRGVQPESVWNNIADAGRRMVEQEMMRGGYPSARPSIGDDPIREQMALGETTSECLKQGAQDNAAKRLEQILEKSAGQAL